ncbi:hypothetical protein ASG47_14505 [Devosia sp. Leaf420]|uniref:hypothetical protein n=1 Tax=Devosia sp. Leaf420 TaxID=1736374 RepID=UPI000713C5B1|nr:hypothetical protein [Devosia sp. Leaf420]KQT44662.1 hypothetical protein ASG47_14505 [Devosia sp. Leaf420]
MTENASIESIQIGRCTITESLIFVGEVIGGGTGGPGKVTKFVDFNRTAPLYFFKDNRSGSKRSGTCLWQLEADALYRIDNVAISSRNTDTFYVSTIGGQPKELSRDEFNAERARIWPLGAQLAAEAAAQFKIDEAARIEREAAEAERRRIEMEARQVETEALKEINAERAAEIAEKGQPVVDGLPELSGTPKQIAYALNIRAAYAEKHPDSPSLKKGTTAKYWIENYRSILFR